MSPSVRHRRIEAFDLPGRLFNRTRSWVDDGGGIADTGDLSGRWGSTDTVKLNSSLQHNTVGMPHSTVRSEAPITVLAAFREPADAWLKQLVRRNPEEIGHAVEVLNLHIPVTIQDFIDPRFVVMQPTTER